VPAAPTTLTDLRHSEYAARPTLQGGYLLHGYEQRPESGRELEKQ